MHYQQHTTINTNQKSTYAKASVDKSDIKNQTSEMHICFTGQYPYKDQTAGGVGSFTQTLAEELVKRNVTVSIIALYPGIPETVEIQNGVQVYWLDQKKWPVANFVRIANKTNQLLKKIHKAHPIDIVETQEAGFAFLTRIPNILFVIRLHGGHYFFSNSLGKSFSRRKAWLEKRSFAKADYYIGVSHFVLNETAKYISFDHAKSVVIPNPVNCTRFYESDPHKAIDGRIVFAGRLVEKKGIRQLIAAMPRVISKFPNAHLHIYGGDTNIDHGHSFQSILVREIPAELNDKIRFFGEIKNVQLPTVLEQAQLCVYPSHMEAMPIAWLEVMAMGKPFIAGRPGPGPEVINDGVDGLLCDPYSPDDIADKITWVLENSEAAMALGRAARRKILENYEMGIITKKNMDYFEEIAGH